MTKKTTQSGGFAYETILTVLGLCLVGYFVIYGIQAWFADKARSATDAISSPKPAQTSQSSYSAPAAGVTAPESPPTVLPPSPQYTPPSVSASPSVPLKRKVINVQPDDQIAIPTEAQIFLRGPMQATIVNTAGRISAHAGEFKLQHEGTDDATWTAGYSPEIPPTGIGPWLYRIRQSAERGQTSSRVRITVDSGTVFLGTCVVAHECDFKR